MNPDAQKIIQRMNQVIEVWEKKRNLGLPLIDFQKGMSDYLQTARKAEIKRLKMIKERRATDCLLQKRNMRKRI